MRIDLGIPPALNKVLIILSIKQVRVLLYCLIAIVIVCTRFPTLDIGFRKRAGKIDDCFKNATIFELNTSQFDKCTSDFLRNYLKYCEETLRPAVTGKQCLCPCASSLLGEFCQIVYAWILYALTIPACNNGKFINQPNTLIRSCGVHG